MSGSDDASDSLRIDKWLWHARFFKTRSLAAKVVSEGKVRVDATPISKPSRSVSPGNVLTFPQGKVIRVIQIDAIGTRRGPAPEAQTLYTDLSPPEQREKGPDLRAPGHDRVGRPTKRDRRAISSLEGRKPLG